MPNVSKSRFRTRRSLRDTLRLTLHARGSPEAIARGFALGLFIAFSPTIGIQIFIALILATLFRANRPAAVVSVFVTNVATIPPLFGLTYSIGAWFLPGSSPKDVPKILAHIVERIKEHDLFNFRDQVLEFCKIGEGLFWPMLIGGIVVGGVCAAIAYPTALWAVRRIRERRKRRLGIRSPAATWTSDADAAPTSRPPEDR